MNDQDSNHSSQSGKAPIWFIIVAVLALIWNLLGLLAFIGQLMMTEEAYAEMAAAEAELFKAIPTWALIAFGAGVIGGTLGSLFLLLRKKWAVPCFLISLFGVVVQFTYMFLMANTIEVSGVKSVVFPIFINLIAIGLMLLSLFSVKKGWIK